MYERDKLALEHKILSRDMNQFKSKLEFANSQLRDEKIHRNNLEERHESMYKHQCDTIALLKQAHEVSTYKRCIMLSIMS